MAGANPAMLIRVAANLAELRANLAEGKSQIETTTAAMQKLAASLDGGPLIQRAHNITAAINQVGISTLTAAQAATQLSVLDRALEKLTLTGKPIPPLMQETADKLRATGDAAKGATVPTESLNVSWGKLVGSYLTAEVILGAVTGAFHAFVGGIASSITAAGNAEKAHVQMVAALRSQGTALPSVITAYQGYATALQQTTIYEDDAIEGAEALLVQVGNVMPRDMKRALDATTNLASGMGIDLHAAVLAVSKAAEGNVTGLKKMGVTVDETKLKSEGFGAVLDAITEKFGGQAAALAGTYQGRLAQLANTWGNVEESIGRAITENATILKVMELVNGTIDRNTGELKNNLTVTTALSDVVILSVRAFSLFATTLDVIQTVGSGFIMGLRTVGMALGDVGIIAFQAARGLSMMQGNFTTAAAMAGPITALKTAVAELGARNETTTGRSVALGNTLQGMAATADGLAAELAKTRGMTVELADAADGGADAWTRQTAAVGANADALKKAAEEQKKYADSLANLNALGATSQEVLDSLDGTVLAGITYYIQRGAKVEDVARLYGLLPAKVEAVKAALEASDKTLKKTTEEFEAIASANRNLTYELRNLQVALPLIPLQSFAGYMAQMPGGLDRAANAAVNLGQVLKKNLNDVLLSVPGTIAAAFTGGGGLEGALKSVAAGIGAAVGGGIGLAVGGKMGSAVGSAIGSLAGPLVGLIGKLFGNNAEKELNPIREAFVQAAGGLATLNARAHEAGVTLDRVLNAKNPESYKAAIDDLNAALQFQDTAMQTLDATVQKYGFTIGELGPRFKQQKLDEQAAGLAQDYQVLIAAGITNVGVLEKMAPAMNEYLKTIQTAGGTIPLQLQAPLQTLADMGLLTDAAGNQLMDLTKLTFAETLDAKFQTLIGSIGKLVDAITRGLGGALGSLPSAFTVPDTTFGGAQASGGDYLVTRPTLFLAGEAGPERASFTPQGRASASSGGSGGGKVIIEIDRRVLAELVVPEIPGVIRRYGLAA
jgi:hypothetical protein